jgi:large subunit ribosomal protein L16
MEGVDEATAKEALRLAQMKLSVATEFISRTPPEE